MRASRGSVRALKKIVMSSGSSKQSLRKTSALSNASSEHDQVIKTQPIAPSTCLDINNNNVSTRTLTDNLTTNLSETGPLMKVVVSPERGPVELLSSTEGATIVHTDASLKHGNAGMGIYFGKDHPLNLSEQLPGKHTSIGWAETIAATTALQKLRGWKGFDNGPVILRTDHLAIVEAMQKEEINPDHRLYVELQTLKKIAQEFPNGVQFEHVYAHNGDEGNEEADALASKATNQNGTPSPRRARSKPPSRRMMRRTRSAYVKRSAPSKLGVRKFKPSTQTAPISVEQPLAALPTESKISPPDAVALRDMKQMEMQAVEKQVSIPQPSRRQSRNFRKSRSKNHRSIRSGRRSRR